MYEQMDHYSLFNQTCESLELSIDEEKARLCSLCGVNNFEDVPIASLDAWAEALHTPHYGHGHDQISAVIDAREAYAAALGNLVSFALTTGQASTRQHLGNELRLLHELAATLPAATLATFSPFNPF